MDDFDVFTNEINYTKPFFTSMLNKYINEAPDTPNGPNYQSGKKLLAEQYFAGGKETECAFHLSEAASASLRTMAVYRDEQLQSLQSNNKLHKVTKYVKPIKDIIDANPISEDEEKFLSFLSKGIETDITERLKKYEINEEMPFYKQYMRFGRDNNVENFMKILKELPKEWTIIQLTAPYCPSENMKPLIEYRTDLDSFYLTVLTGDYLDHCNLGPVTVHVPANVTKEGEKPLFTELYSLLDDNYNTIDKAQFLNNKRLMQNYWSRREDIDLRMKSVINVMDKEWLGGWGCLLAGRLHDARVKGRLARLVDDVIADWGFIKLTPKQKFLLYNLIESSTYLNSHQIKYSIRRILTEHGDIEEIRRCLLNHENRCCSPEFTLLTEVCFKCLSKCFETIHRFTVVDGIRAFSKAAIQVKEDDEWSCLKKAKRHPVILIVDERLDTFPWESLPILSHHPVTRIQNIHFLYYLFKIHEKNIVDGYYIAKTDVGRYVINPEKNLDRMEKRMSSFVHYWCSNWTGQIGEVPPPEEYLRHLNEADVFLYCGHGDGCQLGAGGAGGAGVEGGAARGVVLLAGCGSVRLHSAAPRAASAASHHHLHIAGSPMVVGMLWEVTDLEVDKVVTTLVSLYVPSGARLAWPSVGKAKWSQGVLDTEVEPKGQFVPERDLLRAVARARGSTHYVTIGSSVVARGLPVRHAPSPTPTPTSEPTPTSAPTPTSEPTLTSAHTAH